MSVAKNNISGLLLLILFGFLIESSAKAQNVEPFDNDSILPGIQADKIAIYIEDLKSGEVLLDINAEEPMIPASVTKLVTAATVIHNHQLDNVYSTDILATGIIKDNVLEGNIIVEASGDPTIESGYFPDYKGIADSIANAIVGKGIQKINGRIIVKSPDWLCEPIPSGWERGDVKHPYGAGHHALNYADNRIILNYRSADDYTISPETPDIIINSVRSKSSCVSRNPGENIFTVSHKGKKPLSVSLANPMPESSLRRAIENSLSHAEVEIENREIYSDKPKLKIYTHHSPPISAILESLIVRSDNQMAEAMLRYAWPQIPRAEAARNEIEKWRELGVNMNDVFLEDGSGLSRKNRLTAYALADLLVWMVEKEPDFPRFINMLPRAGQTGTMKNFLTDTPLAGRFWAKTGSMNGIQSYAGYIVDTMNSPTHVVVIMINGFKGERSNIKNELKNLLIEKLFTSTENEQFDIYD